ncbi:MAG TPA: hypothetical protein VNJ08_05215 [Bacteriovoracaceae bacterium]|nr:hypothetical protein [Bacteriovoracaceae bacterium]
MNKTLKSIILLSLSFIHHWAIACLPNEIHVREHTVHAYKKKDGTKVSTHIRSEHCREIEGHNYFQNSTNNHFQGLKAKFKKWDEKEKSQLTKEVENLPSWLKKYKLTEVLRADKQERNASNPAMTIPATKTLLIFDKFFVHQNKRAVLIHEFSHIALWDFPPDDLKKFFLANGWKYKDGSKPIPPQKAFKDDSKNSPSEDFANSVEGYYSAPERLKSFNPQAYSILDQLIKQKERQP